jgi:hypothetical protein
MAGHERGCAVGVERGVAECVGVAPAHCVVGGCAADGLAVVGILKQLPAGATLLRGAFLVSTPQPRA